MKKLLLLLLLTALFVWAALADVTFGDIVKWGLVRRSDLPVEGYRMVCTTNVVTTWVWTLNGYMSSTDEGNPTVLTCDNQVLEDMPMDLVQDGMSGLYPISDTGYYVGPFLYDIYGGFGVVCGNTDPLGGPSCWSEGYTPGQTSYSCSYGLGPYFYWGNFTLTRADTVTTTVTTNFAAVGGGAVLRDTTNPDKFARLENGVFKIYEVVRTPAHWEFQGQSCFGLSNPLTQFSGNLAGYTWSTETAGDPPYLHYALYDDVSMRKFASGPISGVTGSLDFFRDEEPYDVVPMTYVGPSVTTNSL
jgi:hypothetical protein